MSCGVRRRGSWRDLLTNKRSKVMRKIIVMWKVMSEGWNFLKLSRENVRIFFWKHTKLCRYSHSQNQYFKSFHLHWHFFIRSLSTFYWLSCSNQPSQLNQQVFLRIIFVYSWSIKGQNDVTNSNTSGRGAAENIYRTETMFADRNHHPPKFTSKVLLTGTWQRKISRQITVRIDWLWSLLRLLEKL